MKHVLVLYSHNFSADYLANQRLSDKHGLAPNFDSADVFNKRDGFGETVRKGLQTVDGIQFHHFKHCGPTHTSSKPLGKRDIEYWVKQLPQLFEAGETLDAVVMPQGFGVESEANLRWIRELKQHYPNLKVMVQDPILSYDRPEEAPAWRFALPQTEADQIATMIRKATITRDNPNYRLADGIDVVTKNLSGPELANALRDVLGMQPLQEAAKAGGRY